MPEKNGSVNPSRTGPTDGEPAAKNGSPGRKGGTLPGPGFQGVSFTRFCWPGSFGKGRFISVPASSPAPRSVPFRRMNRGAPPSGRGPSCSDKEPAVKTGAGAGNQSALLEGCNKSVGDNKREGDSCRPAGDNKQPGDSNRAEEDIKCFPARRPTPNRRPPPPEVGMGAGRGGCQQGKGQRPDNQKNQGSPHRIYLLFVYYGQNLPN
jgi:hypothetical protein